ncbi:MAG: HEPN domain-containing protein [Ignisphaera sp.]
MKRLGVYRQTHSVNMLLNEVATRVYFPKDLASSAEKLDRYYIPTRYPGAWLLLPPHKHYSRENAEEAINIARKVLNHVRKLLEEDSR